MKYEYPDNVDLLKQLLVSQTSQIEQQSKQIEQLQTQNQDLQVLLEKLQCQVEQLLRKLYGKRTEKRSPDEKESTVKDAVLKSNKQPSLLSGEPKSRAQRKYPKSLRRESVIHDLPEQEQGCICGVRMNRIGQEKTEQLNFKPAELYIKEHIRFKYACRHGCGGVKTAPLPPQPIEKGIPGSGLLAEVLIAKYQDALPLYRQEQRFKRHGYEISRSTLCDWVSQCSFLLEPIVLTMKADMLTALNIFTDDTPVPVQSKGTTKKGRIWPYVTNGLSSPKMTIYDYTPSRTQTAPKNFLGDYQGFLQADAYPGYDKLYQTGRIKEVACMAHARRKFVDVKEAVKSETKADDALELIGKLYDVERAAKTMSILSRYYYRKQYAKPLLKCLHRWLKKTIKTLIPKTPIHSAVQYALNHWIALQNYLADGRLEIDNNRAERAVKPVVIGRKNWLFAGSHDGGKRAATIYSIIETCKQNDINTFEYLSWVLAKIPVHPNKKIRELLPYHFSSG